MTICYTQHASSPTQPLTAAQRVTAHEDKKYDLLQSETVSLTREFLKNTQRLEETIDELRRENEQLQSAALDRGFKQQEIVGLASL